MEENLKPLDLIKFREIIHQESLRMKLNSLIGEGETSFTLALALSAAVKKVFYEKSEMVFSSEPALEKKIVTQFVQRMRVDAMEKFNATTVFASVNLATDEAALQANDLLLTLVVYLDQRFLPEFMRLLQYPYIESEDDEEIKDGCGTLANLLAGQYKRELIQLGYKDLMMSHFTSYINTTADGLPIPKGLMDKYEINFEVDGIKRLVIELVTQEVLPKAKPADPLVSKKILLVDDDEAQTRIMENFLRSEGYDVIVAHDGDEGIKKLKSKPHLIVLDVQMPVMDGYEFILQKKAMEEDIKSIPIIVLTAREGMAEMFKVEGAREYLLKPLQPAALLRSVQRYV